MLLNIQNYRDFFDAHFLEQYCTASQFNLHFFLQLNGKLHVTHTFHSRFFFINTLVVEVEGSIGSSGDLRNEAARLKTAEKMNTPPVKTKKLAGCHFWDKQPTSVMISPTTKTSQTASQKQSTPPDKRENCDGVLPYILEITFKEGTQLSCACVSNLAMRC